MPSPDTSRAVWAAQRELAAEVGAERTVPIDVMDDGIINMLDKMVSASKGEIEAKLLRERKMKALRMQDALHEAKDLDLDLDLSCPICMELMGTQENVPIVLSPCGHSICGACYANLLKYSNRSCPICRAQIREGTPSQIIKHLVSAIHEGCNETKCENCLNKEERIKRCNVEMDSESKRKIMEKRIMIINNEIEALQEVLDSYTEIEERYYKAVDTIDDKIKKLERARATLDREFDDAKTKRDEARDKLIVLNSVMKRLQTESRKQILMEDQHIR